MRGFRHALSWVLAIFLVIMLARLVDVKLFTDAPGENAVFATIAANSGIALFEPTGRFAVGIAEAIALILVFLPWTRRFGAVVCVLITAGAVAFHLSPWLGVETPLATGSDETDGGLLFNLALALLVASVLLVFVHPRSRSRF